MIKEAVILAGGKGSRMKKGQTDPELLSTPKPLLKVNGVPIIERSVRKLSERGLKIILVINPIDEEMFREVLGKYNLSFCFQNEPLGTAHALYSAKDSVKGDLFLVLMGDDLIEFDLDIAISQGFPRIFGFEVDDLSEYGAIVKDREGLAISIREKEIKGSGTVNTGVYIMPIEFFEVFNDISANRKSGEYYLTDAIPLLYKRGKGLRVSKLDVWKGINRIEDLNQAKILMKNEINIRRARIDDLSELLHILLQLSPPGSSESPNTETCIESTLANILSNEDYNLLVAEEGGKIVGTATLLIQVNLTHGGRPYGHIENVVTDYDYRGRGVGKSLVSELIKIAAGTNCYKVILDCSIDNILFYEKCGLVRTAEVEMRIDFNSV